MRPLRAVFLDIDDTLYSTSEFAAIARRNAMAAMVAHGLKMRTADALAELYEVISEFGSNYPNHYNQLIKRLPKEVLPAGNPALLVAAAVAAYHDTKFRGLVPFDTVLETLSTLRERTNLIVGVVTEGLEGKQAEKLVRLGIVPWIHPEAIFISDQIGISKPNGKLYARACRGVGVPPSECLYLGDHPTKDVAPAHSVGMITVRHRHEGGKYAQLEGPVAPDFEIGAFEELLPILRDEFGFDTL